jgi:leader peptidase (prepilin peptidase) / N-methyltransferase
VALVALFFAGLYLGSLTNSLAGRLAAGRRFRGSVLWSRSACPHCGRRLAPWDLVPILSWLLLRGRCRSCAGPIDDGPIVEAAMPAFFLVSYLVWPGSLRGPGLVWFSAWLALGAAAMGLVACAVRRRGA